MSLSATGDQKPKRPGSITWTATARLKRHSRRSVATRPGPCLMSAGLPLVGVGAGRKGRFFGRAVRPKHHGHGTARSSTSTAAPSADAEPSRLHRRRPVDGSTRRSRRTCSLKRPGKSGVRFSAQTFAPFRKKLVRTLREEGADKVLHPKIGSACRADRGCPGWRCAGHGKPDDPSPAIRRGGFGHGQVDFPTRLNRRRPGGRFC